jgi:lysophospholipase L1-like esterase
MLAPLAVLIGSICYLFFLTNLAPLIYLNSIRNIYFDCMTFVQDEYVYKMKPGPCQLDNLEFKTTLTHDADGFRNLGLLPHYDVATIGDSHTHGWGVDDDQTFSYLLGRRFGYSTRNLGIGSYATMRELEVLDEYGADAKYVIFQYCDNDVPENIASLKFTRHEFKARVAVEWRARIEDYYRGKALGLQNPLRDLAMRLVNHSYQSLADWRRGADSRNVEMEGELFAQIVARYRPQLESRRVIIFESADFGRNSHRFRTAFTAELNKIAWLKYRVLDPTRILGFDDYYFLDGHPKAVGHAKLASALAASIAEWEKQEPFLRH